MSQRPSGYARQKNDRYETPAWVTQTLLPHLPRPPRMLWEPAAASGRMAAVLRAAGYQVLASDLSQGYDFLKMTGRGNIDLIVTNPPYGCAEPFILRALMHTEKRRGLVAMLLRTDFDHADTRPHLFGRCSQFAKKLVLTKRIVWFERKGAAPSFNHAWFIWSWEHEGPPVLAYQDKEHDRQYLALWRADPRLGMRRVG